MTPDKTPSEAELLPCPFCGEAAKHSFNSLYGDMSMASCKSCGATAYAPKWNRRAVLAKWGAPAPQGDVAAWLVLADGEPHHVTPGASDDAARLWAEDQTKCGAPYSFTFLPLCPPAAQPQQAAPAPASGELVAEVMFDERKYIQYTIPLELLPVGAKFYTAQEARVPLTSEQQRCIAEAHNVAACEEYFNARPQIDYIANRRIFEAGFSKGYGITAAQKETP